MTETTAALARRHQALRRDQSPSRDLDLALHAGEIVALVGHNGAGKTTQMKLMLGLVRPTAGRVRAARRRPGRRTASRARRDVGYLPESVSFHLALTGARDPRLLCPAQGRRPPPPRSRLSRRSASTAPPTAPSAPIPRACASASALAQALLGAPARPPARRADQRPRPGAAPRLLRHRRRARGAGDDGAARLARADRARGARGSGASSSTAAPRSPTARLDALRASRACRSASGCARPAPSPSRGGGASPTAASRPRSRPTAKIALIARLLADPAAVRDLSIAEPTLDDLYAHFLRREAA